MNRSRQNRGRAAMVADGGAPHCTTCGEPLHFGSDRNGRTTEACACGYRAYVETRSGQVNVPQEAPPPTLRP